MLFVRINPIIICQCNETLHSCICHKFLSSIPLSNQVCFFSPQEKLYNTYFRCTIGFSSCQRALFFTFSTNFARPDSFHVIRRSTAPSCAYPFPSARGSPSGRPDPSPPHPGQASVHRRTVLFPDIQCRRHSNSPR